jgi:competence protein ComFB
MNKAIHNLTEDLVWAEVDKICDVIESDPAKKDLCTCPQCRLDIACYALNRRNPHYIVSHRGLARAQQASLASQQRDADIAALVHEALNVIGHNQRPNFNHNPAEAEESASEQQLYNIPAIVGRIFNGLDFSPMSGLDVGLYYHGKLADMKDRNWQNPCKLVANTEGTFSFWPAPIPVESLRDGAAFERKTISFTLKASYPGMEDLNYVFEIPAMSGFPSVLPLSMDRTSKLADLYMFPPSDDEED